MECLARGIARAGSGILSKNIGKLGMLVPGRKSSTVFYLLVEIVGSENDPGSAVPVVGAKEERIGNNYRAHLKYRYSCPEENGG